MKTTTLCTLSLIGVSLALASCAGLPPANAPMTRVSPDYEAAGDSSGVRAFVYGKRTVLEFTGRPGWLSVRDENGVAVEYAPEGRYVRLNRKLDNFSVWLNTRAVTFKAVQAAPLVVAHQASAPTTGVDPLDTTAAVPLPWMLRGLMNVPVQLTAVNPGADDNAEDLLKLSAAQLKELRRAMGKSQGTEAKELNARLDRIEGQLVKAAKVIVRVQFDTARTDFKPSADVARVLVPAAKAAERVNVRGRTDSRVAGPTDPKLAMGRALAARQYLVEQGVDAGKIKVFARAEGDFIAPSRSESGKALNRRVDIELVNQRYTTLSKHAALLAKAE